MKMVSFIKSLSKLNYEKAFQKLRRSNQHQWLNIQEAKTIVLWDSLLNKDEKIICWIFLIFKEKSNSSPKALSAPWKIQHLLNKVWKSKTNFQFLKKIYHQNIFYMFLLLCTSIIHRIRQNSTITLYSSVNEQISHISWNIEGFINLELFFRKWTKDLKTIISA